MPKGFTEQDAALLNALGVETEPKKVSRNTVREERIIAGFEEIQRFADLHGRAPDRGASRDVFERLYAVRLDRMSRMEECRKLLAPLDRQGLLRESDGTENGILDATDDEALLAELGVEAAPTEITELRHVRSSAEKRMRPRKSQTARPARTSSSSGRSLSKPKGRSTRVVAKRDPSSARRRSKPAGSSSSAGRRPTLQQWGRCSPRNTVTRTRASA